MTGGGSSGGGGCGGGGGRGGGGGGGDLGDVQILFHQMPRQFTADTLLQMPAPSRASASKPRRIPLLIVFAFVTAGVAFITRNHGGILGMFASTSSSSDPDIPSWMKQPFDKQQPLTHTVHSYAEPAHACCKNGSTKCLKVIYILHISSRNQNFLLNVNLSFTSFPPPAPSSHSGAAFRPRSRRRRCA